MRKGRTDQIGAMLGVSSNVGYSHSTNVDTFTRGMKLIGIELQLMTNMRVVVFITWFDTKLFIGFIRYHPSRMMS